jgi:hypothetical protein
MKSSVFITAKIGHLKWLSGFGGVKPSRILACLSGIAITFNRFNQFLYPIYPNRAINAFPFPDSSPNVELTNLRPQAQQSDCLRVYSAPYQNPDFGPAGLFQLRQKSDFARPGIFAPAGQNPVNLRMPFQLGKSPQRIRQYFKSAMKSSFSIWRAGKHSRQKIVVEPGSATILD